MAAGLGTRMRSAVPKHLHDILGRRMVDWVLVAARELGVSESALRNRMQRVRDEVERCIGRGLAAQIDEKTHRGV